MQTNLLLSEDLLFNTRVHTKKKSAPERKNSKDRVTFTPCSNAVGTHKLFLLVIGKCANPRVFNGYKSPVVYKVTNKEWMSRSLCFGWFKNHFISEVKGFPTQVNRQLKALLILNNPLSHHKTDEINFGPNFKVPFLTPNCTGKLQPMGQNLIQNVKVTYRKQLPQHILSENNDDVDVVKALKIFSLKDSVYFLGLA